MICKIYLKYNCTNVDFSEIYDMCLYNFVVDVYCELVSILNKPKIIWYNVKLNI